MSDPMTNLQIEDVLSSIRRLVAEGDKTRVAEKLAPADEKPDSIPLSPAKTPDRLVLTPALRVGGGDADKNIERETIIEADLPEIDLIAAITDPNSTGFGSIRGDATVRAAAQPSGVDVTTSAANAASVMILKDAIQDLTHDDAAQIAPSEALGKSDIEPSFRHFDRDALSRTDAPLHTVIVSDDIDDTFGYGDNLAEDQKPDPKIDEKLNAFLSDDAMLADAGLDEDTLRTLIVEVIREELQGVMGERITRNVRKLVRREIHRVLAAQDFD